MPGVVSTITITSIKSNALLVSVHSMSSLFPRLVWLSALILSSTIFTLPMVPVDMVFNMLRPLVAPSLSIWRTSNISRLIWVVLVFNAWWTTHRSSSRWLFEMCARERDDWLSFSILSFADKTWLHRERSLKKVNWSTRIETIHQQHQQQQQQREICTEVNNVREITTIMSCLYGRRTAAELVD